MFKTCTIGISKDASLHRRGQAAADHLHLVAKNTHKIEIESAALPAVFGCDRKIIAQTSAKIALLDARFNTPGGAYFRVGDTSAETRACFEQTQLRYRTDSRPSLTAQIAHYINGGRRR
jgi:hypothetical protein